MTDCPAPPLWPVCLDAAQVPYELGGLCDQPLPDGGSRDCIFCNDTSDPTTGCVGPSSAGNLRCTGNTAAPPRFSPGLQPVFLVKYGPGQSDIHGNDATMVAQESYHYILQRDLQLDVCPCAPGTYCPQGGQGSEAIWLCRMFVVGSASIGWRMLCNEVQVCEEGKQCTQLLARRISLFVDLTKRPVFVVLQAGDSKPYCFPFADVFCYTSRCENETWDCVGSSGELSQTGGKRARALDRLFTTMNLRYSDDMGVYPHRNPFDITLKNAALHTYSVDRGDGVALVDQIDAGINGGPAHDATSNFDDRNKSTWFHSETFDQDNPGLGSLGPFPPVLGSADFYPEYRNGQAGLPIPITCRAAQAKIDFPAHLTFYKTTIVLHLHVERLASLNRRVRVFGDVMVWISLRVKLLEEAFAQADALEHFSLMGSTDDPFDLRVADPDDPEVEHQYERLVAFGPNGERVPRILTWRGLRMDRRHSRVLVDPFDFGRPSWDEIFPGTNTGLCCDVLSAIHHTFLFGELNDGSEWVGDETIELKPQRYEGVFGLGVPALDPDGGDPVLCR